MYTTNNFKHNFQILEKPFGLSLRWRDRTIDDRGARADLRAMLTSMTYWTTSMVLPGKPKPEMIGTAVDDAHRVRHYKRTKLKGKNTQEQRQ
jgi:hypothetical protein